MMIFDWLFRGRNLYKALNPEKLVKLHGIPFTIRKMNPIDYVAGSQALLKRFDVYQKALDGNDIDPVMVDRVKRHYRDVFMAGIVSVRCNGIDLLPSREPVPPGEHKIYVDNFMTDWQLAEDLYGAIVAFTYGKKKLSPLPAPKKSLSS